MDVKHKARLEIERLLIKAGLPVTGRYDDTITYSRQLNKNEIQVANNIQRRYETGEFDYLDKRIYPPVEEQLEMIYDDIENWRANIAAIKAANPKGLK